MPGSINESTRRKEHARVSREDRVAASAESSSPLDPEHSEAGFLVLLTKLGLLKIEPRMAYIE